MTPLRQQAAWRHRRVETITVLSHEQVRRQVSVDFTVPEAQRQFYGRTGVYANAQLSADPGVSVLQLEPTIKMLVNTSNRYGATIAARFLTDPSGQRPTVRLSTPCDERNVGTRGGEPSS